MAPTCGDGVVTLAAGETCDDLGNVSGDGCSATCQLEANYVLEQEPNNTQGMGNTLGGAVGFVGDLPVMGDLDWFVVDVTVPGSSISIVVGDGLGGCPSGLDSEVSLFSSLGMQLAVNDDTPTTRCSELLPSTTPEVTSLAAGTYAVRVNTFLPDDVAPFYVVTIRVLTPGCGDGVLQPGEQCDDTNMVTGDGCSAVCQLEGNFTLEAEVNDTQALANALGVAEGVIAAIQPVGDLDYFSFGVVVPGSSVFAQVDDGTGRCPVGFDPELSFFGPAGTLLVTADNGPLGLCSTLTPLTEPAARNLQPGTYKLRVNLVGNSLTRSLYVLRVRVMPPGCGDGVVGAGEQCDDANVASGDGCSATCQAEAPREIEPNNTQQTATPPWPGFARWEGAIRDVGDHDYFSFTLAAPAQVRLETHDVGNALACSMDTVIRVVDANGVELAADDDGGVDACSLLDPIRAPLFNALPAGSYAVWVQAFDDLDVIPAYQLDLVVQ